MSGNLGSRERCAHPDVVVASTAEKRRRVEAAVSSATPGAREGRARFHIGPRPSLPGGCLGFAAHAWALQHRRLLSTIPRALLVESDRGLSEVWCSFFRETLPHQPACGLLCLRLAHYHGRTIDVSNHSHVRYGSNRTGRKALPGLIRWSHEAFRRHYLKSAAGWPPAQCLLPLNRTSPALSAVIPWIRQEASSGLRCGAGCKRRNRMTIW